MQIKYRSQLKDLLKQFKMIGDSAEVGAASGLFSAEILSWGVPKLYMIDIWETKPFFGCASYEQSWHDFNYESAKKHVEKYGDKAIFLKGMSTDVVENIPAESLSFIYIDATHTYEAVLEDLKTYFPKLKKGGIMSGHDYLCKDYGVEQAVIEFCSQMGYIPNTIPEESIENASFWFQKL